MFDGSPEEVKLNQELTTKTEIIANPFNDLVATPNQEKEVLIANSKLLHSQDLAINPKPLIPRILPREEIPPWENLSDTDGLDFQFNKRPLSIRNSNYYEKESLK